MKFSIITPTHNLKYIHELEESILNQTYQDWEWIVLLNNDALNADFKPSDERIKVYNSRIPTTAVGGLKKQACSFAIGDVIVEADHDDILTSDCLEELYKAYSLDKEIGFVYSDNAKLSNDFVPYNPHYGWEWYKYPFRGKEYFAMKSQPLNAGRLGYVWFAPDHVRSWKKDVYDSISGHNENMSICDDQDLMHRLYLVTKFHYIPKVLYIYRIDGSNTWLKRNEDIQNTTVSLYNKNIYSLAERWADIHGLMKIDLCGGFNKPKGYTSIDVYDGDIIADLEKGIPLPDNSVGVIRAHDALEHIKDSKNLMFEIHRVLAKGGMLLSSTPSTDGRGAWQDPTHCCYSDDTEVFTDDGFKFFKDLSKDDYIYSYNQEKNLAELDKPLRFFEYDYDGDLIKWEGRNSSCMVTPNHNMYVGSSDDTSKFRFMEAKDAMKYKSPLRLPSNVEFIGDIPEYFEIPNSIYKFQSNPKDNFNGDNIRLKIEPFMEFMGWFLSEGSSIIHKTKKGYVYRISIFQCESANKEKFERIGDCLRELGYKPYKNKNGWHFTDKYLALYLSQFGKSYQKYIPNNLKQLDPSLLSIMIESLLLGDGNKNGENGHTYSSTSRRLASDFQEISIKCGYRTSMSMENRIGKIVSCNPDYRSNHNIYRVYISKSKHSYLPRSVETIDYKGKIYCVEMPKNNVVLTRRGGKTMWAGNSFWNQNSFFYYTRHEQAQYIRNSDKMFRECALYTHFPSQWHKENNVSYVVAQLEKI